MIERGRQSPKVMVVTPQALKTARALVVERKNNGRRSPLLRTAGAIVLAKVNMLEFASDGLLSRSGSFPWR